MTISARGRRDIVLVSTIVLAIAMGSRSHPAVCSGSPPSAEDSGKPVSSGAGESQSKSSSPQHQTTAASPQSKPAERVIWLKFLGESDRSVPIALISDSDRAIDAFMATQPKDSVVRHGSRVLV
jgi:hypothetical protein